MRTVQVYIEGQRLELFKDEQISVNSSVQNIADISKVFTDFSQSFTVPASPYNNEIFEHFYQSDIDGTIDHNIRRRAKIEIDLTDFRRGKIQLEKANLKDGQVESYTITFYGDIRTLKDAFGEDKLNALDLTSLEFAYDGTEIYDRITDTSTDYDVRYPLIANNRLWTYGDATAEDITTNGGAIQYDELFPAVKVSKLFEAIENTYGLTLTGTFLTDPRFTQCFLLAKNLNEYTNYTESEDIDFTSVTGTSPNPTEAASKVDVTENSILVEDFESSIGTVSAHIIQVGIISISSPATYYIDVFQDGNYYSTIEGNTAASQVAFQINNTTGLSTTITFKIKASAATTIDLFFTYQINFITDPIGSASSFCSIVCNPVTLSGNVSINNTLPDIKVSDFFTGVLKQFNATCVAVGTDTFEVLPLDEWYAQGDITDITEFTDIESIDVERIKLYKNIVFKYQQSNSFVNRQFFTLTGREYGDLDYKFNYDGSEYKIEQPFENLQFTEFTGSGVFAGFCLDENFQAYTPKPVLLYFYGQGTAATPIKFFDDTTTQDITDYAIFSQDIIYQTQNYSLNWGAEISIVEQQTISNGLYQTYYFPYLVNLYNLKNRLYQVKTILPVSLLTELRLNDRLVIRDKRYIINEMKSNLTTGEVNFSLLLDFREVSPDKVIEASKDAQCLQIPINLPNKAIQADITTTASGVTITPATITESQDIEVCIPANTESETFIITEDSQDYLNTEEYERFITDETETQIIVLLVTYTFSNGSLAQTQIIIQQP
jgi:hypothetical protein